MTLVHLPNLRYLFPVCLLAVACGETNSVDRGPVDGGDPTVTAPADGGPGEPEDPTVHGRIITSDGRPVGGLQVLIPGHPVVVSDTNGGFEVRDVDASYEVAFIDGEVAKVFQGITRRNPTFTADSAGEFHSALARGRASGGDGFPATAQHFSAAALEATVGGSPSTVINQNDGSFDLAADWKGVDAVTAVAHGLQWRTTADGRFDVFTGHGTSASFELRASQVHEGTNLVMSAVGTARLSGSVSLAAGARLTRVLCAVDMGARAEITVWDEEDIVSGLATHFECPVPELESARGKIYLDGEGAGHLHAIRSSAPGTSGSVQVSFAATPTLVSPAEGSTDAGAQTLYSWNGGAGLAQLSLLPTSGTMLVVTTSKMEARLPDLTPLGISLPRNAEVRMSVTTRAEAATIDEALAPGWATEMAGTVTEASSAIRLFATAP